MGRKKSKIFFLFLRQYKWVLRCFGHVLTTFVFRGQQIRYITPCIRYGGKKIEKFFFVSYALKMILKGFWTCFDDFWFSRSANPLHDSMCKVWTKKIENFFLFLMQYKWNLMCFGRVSTTIVFRGRQIRYIYSLLINTLAIEKKAPAKPVRQDPRRGGIRGGIYRCFAAIVSDY